MKTLTSELETHLKMLRELLTLLKKETGELSNVRLDAMSEVNKLKEAIAERIQAHSGSLRKAIEDVSVREGLTSGTTLGELAAKLKLKGGNNVAHLHTELNKTAGQLKEQLELNRLIAERFATSVGNTLDLLTRVINQASTYGASGGYQQRPSGAVLINREA